MSNIKIVPDIENMKAVNMIFQSPEVQDELMNEYISVPISRYEELIREETELNVIYDSCKNQNATDFMATVIAVMSIRDNQNFHQEVSNA